MAMQRVDQQLEQLHIHSKPVSNYDKDGMLALPVLLAGHVWPRGLPDSSARESLRVIDINFKPWCFTCKVRCNPQGNPKPEVFGPEWRQFILEKGVCVGDELAFYHPPPSALTMPPNEAPVFLISVKRNIKLYGETMPGHIRD